MNFVDGTYPGRATALQWGESKKGDPQVVITLQLLSGPNRGQHITWFGNFSTPKVEERTLESLAYLGWPKGKHLHELTVDDLQSMVDVVIGTEEYQGKNYTRVQWINRPGGGGITLKSEMTPDAIKAFSAKMAAKAQQVKRYDPVEVPDELGSAAYADDEPAGSGNGSYEGPPDYGDPPPSDSEYPFGR